MDKPISRAGKGSRRDHGAFNRGAHDRELHTTPNQKFFGARIYHDGSPSHTSTGSFEAVPFNTEDYDVSPGGDLVDISNNAFKIPRNGFYDIRVQVKFNANATGRRRLKIVSANSGDLSAGETAANATVLATPLAVWRGRLKKGDVITFEALQASGGNLAYNTGTNFHWAEIQLVGV